MREFTGLAANTVLIPYRGDTDNLVGAAELILMVSEPKYRLDEISETHYSTRVLDDIRFSATLDGIDLLIDSLEQVRDDIVSLQNKVKPRSE